MPRTAGKPSTGGQPPTARPPLSLFPGDGIVSFKDFLGVLTDSHRLAQCLGEGQGWWGRSGWAWPGEGSSLLSPMFSAPRQGEEQLGL